MKKKMILLYALIILVIISANILAFVSINKVSKLERENAEYKNKIAELEKENKEWEQEYYDLYNANFDEELYQCELERDYWYFKYTGQDWRMGA